MGVILRMHPKNTLRKFSKTNSKEFAANFRNNRQTRTLYFLQIVIAKAGGAPSSPGWPRPPRPVLRTSLTASPAPFPLNVKKRCPGDE